MKCTLNENGETPKRIATIKATASCTCWAVDAATFRKVAIRSKQGAARGRLDIVCQASAVGPPTEVPAARGGRPPILRKAQAFLHNL